MVILSYTSGVIQRLLTASPRVCRFGCALQYWFQIFIRKQSILDQSMRVGDIIEVNQKWPGL